MQMNAKTIEYFMASVPLRHLVNRVREAASYLSIVRAKSREQKIPTTRHAFIFVRKASRCAYYRKDFCVSKHLCVTNVARGKNVLKITT